MNRSLISAILLPCFGLLFAGCLAGTASGQMIHTQTPLQQGGSGFYESSGVNWSLRGRNFFASFGQGPLLPQFGNPTGDTGLRTGFGFGGGGGLSGNLGFNFSQGSSRGFSSTTPSLTTTNGYPGSIFSGTVRPFVTGFSPVVGDYSVAAPVSPEIAAYYQGQQADLQRRINAAANAKHAKTLEAYKRGLRAEEEGNLKMARANYKRALATANGPLRVEIYQRLQSRGR